MNHESWSVYQRSRKAILERKRSSAEAEVERLEEQLMNAQNRVGELDTELEQLGRETFREALADHAFDQAKERRLERGTV